jgi:hypothetical protein
MPAFCRPQSLAGGMPALTGFGCGHELASITSVKFGRPRTLPFARALDAFVRWLVF